MRHEPGDEREGDFPEWVPIATRRYLAHTEDGLSIRRLAREAEVHASTILRQIRRTEVRRDDPLVDDAIRALTRQHRITAAGQGSRKRDTGMGKKGDLSAERPGGGLPAGKTFEGHALRILRRLGESGAVLAVARDMEMGVVVRDLPDGTPQRTAVVERDVAQAMALREWILPADPGARIVRYRITGAGRAALKDLAARADGRSSGQGGFAEAQAEFDRGCSARGGEQRDDGLLRHARSMMQESPLAGLARRRDKDGSFFLSRTQVATGERLREDYELAQLGTYKDIDWSEVVAGNVEPPSVGDDRVPPADAAAHRLGAALVELGPGLGDVVLRCCCLLEGFESLEQSLGWSARSGKIVLRIALQRLQRHYDETEGRYGPMIG